MGLTLLIPQLGDWFARAIAGLTNTGNRLTQKPSGNDLLTGILVGAGIGLVWVPCSGPILAAVIVQSEAAGAALRYNFYSKKVYLVLATATGKPIAVDVRLDDKPVGANGGQSVTNSMVTVSQNTLYELVRLPGASSGVLEIVARSPGLRAYAFTFGGKTIFQAFGTG